jgi:hypothetical protein
MFAIVCSGEQAAAVEVRDENQAGREWGLEVDVGAQVDGAAGWADPYRGVPRISAPGAGSRWMGGAGKGWASSGTLGRNSYARYRVDKGFTDGAVGCCTDLR